MKRNDIHPNTTYRVITSDETYIIRTHSTVEFQKRYNWDETGQRAYTESYDRVLFHEPTNSWVTVTDYRAECDRRSEAYFNSDATHNTAHDYNDEFPESTGRHNVPDIGTFNRNRREKEWNRLIHVKQIKQEVSLGEYLNALAAYEAKEAADNERHGHYADWAENVEDEIIRPTLEPITEDITAMFTKFDEGFERFTRLRPVLSDWGYELDTKDDDAPAIVKGSGYYGDRTVSVNLTGPALAAFAHAWTQTFGDRDPAEVLAGFTPEFGALPAVPQNARR